MLAPQSDAEVRPVVEALQRLDPLLDIQWQPKAILVRRGSYSVHGTRVDPEYDGRWEVIRWDTSVSLHKERTWTRITLVTQLDLTGKYPQMVCDGPYMPIGPWLVSFMQLWDAAQSAFAHQMDVVRTRSGRCDHQRPRRAPRSPRKSLPRPRRSVLDGRRARESVPCSRRVALAAAVNPSLEFPHARTERLSSRRRRHPPTGARKG
jgi:hypothetical protein